MEKTAKNNKVKRVCITGLMAALVCVATAFIKMPTGINSGYLHFGDSMIYIAACVLPLPYACAAAAVGGFVADMLAGAAMWAPFTAVIKALNALPFALVYTLRKTQSPQKILNKTTAFMPIVSGLITIFGYFLVEGLLYTFPSAAVSMLASLVQATGSAVIYYIFAAALDKLDFKKRIMK